jgi:hypothetical protein
LLIESNEDIFSLSSLILSESVFDFFLYPFRNHLFIALG